MKSGLVEGESYGRIYLGGMAALCKKNGHIGQTAQRISTNLSGKVTPGVHASVKALLLILKVIF